MKKILLCSMPFGALDRPALGLSLLKQVLKDSGILCDIRYLNFKFAEFIGGDDYQRITLEFPHTAFAGDWAFTAALYGEDPASDNRYIKEVLKETWLLAEEDIARVRRVRLMVEPFLDHCIDSVPWGNYRAVGFTSTFEQNIASLALAQRVKERHPGLAIIFGGANWEGEMGMELHRQFPFVDFVCSGEADLSFPVLARRLLSGKVGSAMKKTVPGVIYRKGGRTLSSGPAELIRNLDELPFPDYDDYFREFYESAAALEVLPNVLFEGSRGCWWGQKSQCTFCGLNSGTIGFRSKSAERSLDEIDFLVRRWQFDYIQAVDNILDMKSFKDFLPALASSERKLQFFFEVKANLNRDHVRMLSKAGIGRVQPGIESLNDHVLKLMRKGTTALKNIQMLKWAREYGVEAEWNLLYGFPGERREDYEDMLCLIKQVRFLKPPGACGPVRMDRFSPFFKDPDRFGFINLRPMKVYRFLYPFDDETLANIAYYFDYDYQTGIAPDHYAGDVISYVNEWQANPEKGSLVAVSGENGALAIIDTRSDALRRHTVLKGFDRDLYEYCDSCRTPKSVLSYLRGKHPDRTFSQPKVRHFLDTLVANRLMVTDGQRYLSLASFKNRLKSRIPQEECEPAQRLST